MDKFQGVSDTQLALKFRKHLTMATEYADELFNRGYGCHRGEIQGRGIVTFGDPNQIRFHKREGV